jgi:Protein of unknown function (DUF3426)
MFINCPYCSALVATDPVTDLPPTHCPHCTSLLRRDETVADDTEDTSSVDLGDLLEAPADQHRHEYLREHLDAHVDNTPHDDQSRSAADQTAIDMTAAENAPTDTLDNDTNIIADAENTAAVAVTAPSVLAPATAAAPVLQIARRTRAMPSFVRGVTAPIGGPHERWVPAVAAALALLLVLQLLLADRARLAADPQWRPVLETMCKALFCELPPWQEPKAFTLMQRDVRQHPSIPGALRVSATFRNDARWPQPWPQLRLTLADVNGRTAGERSFHVNEYLGGPPNQAELASGESATVAMDILEPAARIVAYDFSFR